jgi:hypothetical protein
VRQERAPGGLKYLLIRSAHEGSGGRREAVGSLNCDQALQQIEMAMLFEDPGQVMAHNPRLRVGRHDGPTDALDKLSQSLRSPPIVGLNRRRD